MSVVCVNIDIFLQTCRSHIPFHLPLESHRSDTNLKDVFESLFPGQIEHAEMLINTSTLEHILKRRATLVEKYDRIDARYRFQQWQYDRRQGVVGCCNEQGFRPDEPKVRILPENMAHLVLI